ncbi:MAG: hypothetical protein K6A30_08930 [Lachnospiraceae bacterium]|nr:hypothetical protein [Lachnospiraceae bacterium]
MGSQSSFENVVKEIHIMVSECPTIKGNPDNVVINKNQLFDKLNSLSQCLYEMLDEFELTKQKKEEANYKIKKYYRETVDNAQSKAEDVYSASVLYTDEAITRLVRLIDESEKSVELQFVEFERKLQKQKDEIRANQKELQDLLFEMQDDSFYINLLNERRRKIEQEKPDKNKKTPTYSSEPIYPKPEIKINKQYFEHMGLNEDGTPKIEDEVKVETPEIKVDMNSNYFKWKKQQEGMEQGVQEEGVTEEYADEEGAGGDSDQ